MMEAAGAVTLEKAKLKTVKRRLRGIDRKSVV